MNKLRNSVHLIGHLGRDPELFSFDSGKVKASVSLATTDYYKNGDGERKEDTQWHNLVAWNKTAELIGKMLRKGSEVAVEGRLANRKYEDKEGNSRIVTEVVIDGFHLFDKKKKEG